MPDPRGHEPSFLHDPDDHPGVRYVPEPSHDTLKGPVPFEAHDSAVYAHQSDVSALGISNTQQHAALRAQLDRQDEALKDAVKKIIDVARLGVVTLAFLMTVGFIVTLVALS